MGSFPWFGRTVSWESRGVGGVAPLDSRKNNWNLMFSSFWVSKKSLFQNPVFLAVKFWSTVILDSLARIFVTTVSAETRKVTRFFGSTDFNVDIEIYSMSWLLLYKRATANIRVLITSIPTRCGDGFVEICLDVCLI